MTDSVSQISVMSQNLHLKRGNMKLKQYQISCKVSSPIKCIIAADLHGRGYNDSLTLIESCKPDIILSPGDMLENALSNSADSPVNRLGFEFLSKAAKTAPLFYSLGNHEIGMSDENLIKLKNAGITLLDNEYTETRINHTNLCIGGLTSGYICRSRGFSEDIEPDVKFLAKFDRHKTDGIKFLLCHHPEYYISHYDKQNYHKSIKATSIDITVSGHAHGGQWKLFGKSIYAPGQGLLPKYASGVYENRLCVSCGMANTVIFPRFFNPRELVLLTLIPEEK